MAKHLDTGRRVNLSNKDRRVWVAIMRRSPNGFQVLLGKRGDHCNHPKAWGLFGGKVDDNEDLLVGAKREVLEETGLDLDAKASEDLFYMGESTENYNGRELHWYVYGAGDIKKKDCQITKEVSEYSWVTLEHCKKLKLHYSAAFFFQGLKAHLEYSRHLAPVHSLAKAVPIKFYGDSDDE